MATNNANAGRKEPGRKGAVSDRSAYKPSKTSDTVMVRDTESGRFLRGQHGHPKGVRRENY